MLEQFICILWVYLVRFQSLSVCLFAGEIEFDPSEVVLAKREPVLEFVLEIGREIDNLVTDIDKGLKIA